MKKKKSNITLYALILLLVVGVAGVGYFLYHYLTEEQHFKALKPRETEDSRRGLDYYLINGQIVQKKFKDLYIKNQDFAGWIMIEDTNIDYPVMHTPEDEAFYIHADFDKNYSYSGSIFASAMSDFEPESDNILLYGHHMRIGTMFQNLMKYEDQEWFETHKYIRFDTLYRNGTYEVIAAFRTKIYEDESDQFVYYNFADAYNKEEFDDYVENVKNLSAISTDTTAEYGDKLLSLSTCAYHTADGRFVVVAKKVDGEEILPGTEPLEIIN